MHNLVQRVTRESLPNQRRGQAIQVAADAIDGLWPRVARGHLPWIANARRRSPVHSPLRDLPTSRGTSYQWPRIALGVASFERSRCLTDQITWQPGFRQHPTIRSAII